MISLALVPLLFLSADEPKWELSAEESGVKVYGRKKEGGDLREMKAQGIINATPEEVWKPIRELENYKAVMPYTEEAKVLSREKEGKVTYFYSRLNTPLVDRRDYILRLVDESDGKGTFKVSWKAVNDQDALQPVNKDVVRVRINDGYWLLEPREDGKKTFVTYYIYTNPGGSIPGWIADRANGTAVPKVFDSIKKAVENERKKAPAAAPAK